MLYTLTTKLETRFVAEDFCFVRSVLAPSSSRTATALGQLWNDADALREILDLKEILRMLLDSADALPVSPAFYFYVMVRHALLDAGIDDSEVADYMAEVLVEKLEAAPEDPLRSLACGYTRAAEFITILQHSHGRMRFHLQVAAGDQFLVLAGMYPGYLKRRAEQRGAPEIGFYDSFAQRVYRDAAENPHAPKDAPRRAMAKLAEVLPTARKCLNKVAEEFVFLGE